MTTTHTQGRLRVGSVATTVVSETKGPGVPGYDDSAYGGFMVAESVHPENARRLAACWNACIDIPTEALEQVEDCDTPVFQLLTQTWEERDVYATQLHALVQFFDEWEQILPHDAREALRQSVEKARKAPAVVAMTDAGIARNIERVRQDIARGARQSAGKLPG